MRVISPQLMEQGILLQEQLNALSAVLKSRIAKIVTAHILLARFISPLLQLSKTVAKNSEDGVLPIKYEQLPKILSTIINC